MRIYLIRHVATEYNLSGVYMGRTNDISIDNNQAIAFNLKIASNKKLFESTPVILSSPATRCLQTARLVTTVVNTTMQVIADEGFMETNMGCFEGKTAEVIKKEYPKEFELWQRSAPDFVFPGGESYLAVQQRSYDALNVVVAKSSDLGDMIIVTHVDVIKMLIFKILGVSVEMKKFLYIDNGSLSCLETYKDGYKVKFMNL